METCHINIIREYIKLYFLRYINDDTISSSIIKIFKRVAIIVFIATIGLCSPFIIQEISIAHTNLLIWYLGIVLTFIGCFTSSSINSPLINSVLYTMPIKRWKLRSASYILEFGDSNILLLFIYTLSSCVFHKTTYNDIIASVLIGITMHYAVAIIKHSINNVKLKLLIVGLTEIISLIIIISLYHISIGNIDSKIYTIIIVVVNIFFFLVNLFLYPTSSHIVSRKIRYTKLGFFLHDKLIITPLLRAENNLQLIFAFIFIVTVPFITPFYEKNFNLFNIIFIWLSPYLITPIIIGSVGFEQLSKSFDFINIIQPNLIRKILSLKFHLTIIINFIVLIYLLLLGGTEYLLRNISMFLISTGLMTFIIFQMHAYYSKQVSIFHTTSVNHYCKFSIFMLIEFIFVISLLCIIYKLYGTNNFYIISSSVGVIFILFSPLWIHYINKQCTKRKYTLCKGFRTPLK